MRKDEFILVLERATEAARSFASEYLHDFLPAKALYQLRLNVSEDDPSLVQFDIYPEDKGKTLERQSAQEVTELLCRNGKVPVWINISALSVSGPYTIFNLQCAGRYSDDPELLYYRRTGTAPFGIKSPVLPPGYIEGSKFKIAPTIYLFPGLGADRRVFANYHLDGSCEVRHITTPAPMEDETLPQYAARLASQIDQEQSYFFVGVSFGGMLAIELGAILNPTQVVVISSATNRQELPLYYRFFGELGIHRILPYKLLTRPSKLAFWAFGANTPLDRQVLGEVLSDTDPAFLRWALNAILKWRRKARPENVFHIHGTHDRIIPMRNVQADRRFKGGGHWMVYDWATEIGVVLHRIILPHRFEQED